MKVINMIIFLLSVLNHFTIKAINPSSNWIVDIANEQNTDDIVEVRKGAYTKVTVNVYHADNPELIDASFDKSVFIISPVHNSEFMFPNKELKIIPSKSLRYTTYFGLSCNSQIQSNIITTLEFYIKEKRTLSGDYIEDSNIIDVHVNPLNIQINTDEIPIDIVPIETNIVGGGYSLFRINETYNVEKVIIGANGYNTGKFVFDKIEIEPFDERKKFDPEINENHGILFDFKFGTQFEYKELQCETSVTYYLEMKVENFIPKYCFDISLKSKVVSITVVDKKKIALDDSIKQEIVKSIENITPEKDETNNIQLKFNLPVAPVIVECELEGKDDEDDEVKYKDYFLYSGQNLIKFNDLKPNLEYEGECLFSSLTFLATRIKNNLWK